MSGKVCGTVKWDSSTEEDDLYEPKYRMKLRESLRNAQQPSVTENETVVAPRKRGRGPSKRPCLNRNALMARENRLRKKAYLEKIENKLSFYQQENKSLVNTIRKQGIDIKRLSGEVAYLRSVLNNNTSITTLLKTINEGLRKMGTQKRNMIHPNDGLHYPNDSDVQHKCTCCLNMKENLLNSQNINVFVNTTNDHSMEHNAAQYHSNGTHHVNTKKQINCKNLDTRKLSSPTLNTDHTYTVSKNSTVSIKSEVESKAAENPITSTASSISQESDDSYLDNTREFDSLMQTAQLNLPNIDEKKDIDMINTDFDQLSSFNMDIFEDLPKCDEIMSTEDALHDTSNLFTEEEMLQSLDNTGICLHVNSDKLSLEFCSICHLNSNNSELN